jgi:protein-S-isoprenylcysteine O-methyltransferase Ste14
MTDVVTTAQPMSPEVRRGVIAWFAKAVIGMPVIAVILFGAAGTVHWAWGWVFWVLGVLAVFAHGLSLARLNPALLAARSTRVSEQVAPRWDKVLVTLGAGILPYASWIVAALDFRFGWTQGMPLALRLAAVALWVLAWVWILWATVANRFFTTTVQIQPGHQVASSGPYRYVRHPGYAGAIVYQLLSPIILGSWWALVPAVLVGVCFTLRTALEDRFLHEHLAGYRDYAARVRYRLIPGLW